MIEIKMKLINHHLISSTIEIENLRILKSTQSFVINDIGYSYMNIDDTLDKTSTVGRVKNLPEFPRYF